MVGIDWMGLVKVEILTMVRVLIWFGSWFGSWFGFTWF
jgi:hypothetical protein